MDGFMDKGRVLFVDDETQVLRSLKRALRLHCKEWELFFFSSPVQALSELTELKPWVIVSDKKMSEMSGEDFLLQAKEIWPDSVRVILTGDTSQDSALVSLRSAHLLLPKPFEIDELLSALKSAVCLRSFSLDANTRSELGGLQTLPVLPRVYQQLVSYLDAVEQPDNDHIAKLISSDVAVLTKVIQLANSSFFGFSQPVYEAKDVIVRLGHDLIKKMLLIAGLFNSIGNQGEAEKLFNTAISVAEKVRELAILTGQVGDDIERAYFCGLLHNLGYLVKETNNTLLSADLIGAFILQLWGFEAIVVNAVRYQSMPESSPDEEKLVFQLCIAKTLVNEEKQNLTYSEVLASIDEGRVEKAGLIAYLRN